MTFDQTLPLVYGLDFETFYSKEVSITEQGTYWYLRHPEQCGLKGIYMLTIAGSDGFEYVGKPQDFDWEVLRGKTILIHHASFDLPVVERLKELGAIPQDLTFGEVFDTADLAAYLGAPRALSGAAYRLLGITVSKHIRDLEMKGLHWDDMSEMLKDSVRKYALQDPQLCVQLWQKHGHLWPENERIASRLTREMAWRGVMLDTDKLEASISTLKDYVWKATNDIPWDGPPQSAKQLAIKCREVGIEPPKSLAADSEECAEWEDTYGERYPWVDAMRRVRRGTMLLRKLETMKSRLDDAGRMRYELKYCGANPTARWSGSGRINMQNLPSKDMFGVDVRGCIIAPPGKTFIISDKSQIEPRCLAKLAGYHEFLAEVAQGVSPYIVHARLTMGLGADEVWAKTDTRYKMAKIRVLGLGYGCGWVKFIFLAKVEAAKERERCRDKGEPCLSTVLDAFDVPVTEQQRARFLEYLAAINNPDWNHVWATAGEVDRNRFVNSWLIVTNFRQTAPKIPALWKKLGDAARESSARGHDYTIVLPSGRELIYHKCRFRKTEIICDIVKNGKWITQRLYGGLLAENATQAMARDSFRDDLINVAAAGYPIVMQAHDEAVEEVDLETAEQSRADIERIMSISPSWCPSLPVAAEAQVSPFYMK